MLLSLRKSATWGATVLLVVLFTHAAALAQAGDILGVDIQGGDGGDTELIRVDPATGAATTIGPVLWGETAVRSIEALGWDPATSTLYAGSSYIVTSNYPGMVWAIDPATAAATPVGQATLGGVDVSGFEAIDFAPDGTLYAATDSQLLTMDAVTGVCTLIGNLSGTRLEGMAFDAGGTLWGVADLSGSFYADTLVQVDTGTSAVTTIGALGYGDVDGFDILADGTFIATDRTTFSAFTIDPATGAGTPLGAHGVGLVAALQQIPEPATLSLLAVGGLAVLRRRRSCTRA